MGPIGVPELIVVVVFGGAIALIVRWAGRVSRLKADHVDLQRRVEALERRTVNQPTSIAPSERE